MAEATTEGGKPEKRTLERNIKPRLSELMGGKIGTVILEGLVLVEEGAKSGRKALEKRLNGRIDNVSNEASAASGAASRAETAASKAAGSAAEAEAKASAASNSAAEMEAKAAAMSEDVAKATGDASEAKDAAAGAKSAAEQASADVAEITEALTVTVKPTNGDSDPETLTPMETIEFLVGKLSTLSSAVAGFLDRVVGVERKQKALEDGLSTLREETEGTLKLYMQVLQMHGLIPSEDNTQEGGEE